MTTLETVNGFCIELKKLEKNGKIGGRLSPSELVAIQILEDVDTETCLRIAHIAMNEAVKKVGLRLAIASFDNDITLPMETLG